MTEVLQYGCGGIVPPGAVTVADPVCGMKVDAATSKHQHEHDGVTYYFCCGGCRAKFAADRAKFLTGSPEAAGTKTASDPVCGMMVDPATSKHCFDHGRTTYHLIAECRQRRRRRGAPVAQERPL